MKLRKVIAGWGGGEPSRDALRFAALVATAAKAELVVVHAYHYETPLQSSAAELRLKLRAEATARLAEAEAALPYGSRATWRVAESRSVVQGLHDFAAAENADLIVLGSVRHQARSLHPRARLAERLLHDAPCAVAVAPPGFAREENPGLRVIGVAYDGSPEAQYALETAAELALQAGAALKLIEVVEEAPPVMAGGIGSMYALAQTGESYQDSVRHGLESAAESLPPQLRAQTILVRGEPAPEIIERADLLSLLVMGSRGYGPLRRALLGSVSTSILRAAPCPILVAPRCERAEAAAPAAQLSS